VFSNPGPILYQIILGFGDSLSESSKDTSTHVLFGDSDPTADSFAQLLNDLVVKNPASYRKFLCSKEGATAAGLSYLRLHQKRIVINIDICVSTLPFSLLVYGQS